LTRDDVVGTNASVCHRQEYRMSADPKFKHGPLSDLRVIEMGTLLAGPFCGQLLGDMGAEVIKIEPPGQGDPLRVWGRQKAGEPSLWWPVVARNKKAIRAFSRT
jgi:formyl-CoA transferase